jgi:hypothetical protein
MGKDIMGVSGRVGRADPHRQAIVVAARGPIRTSDVMKHPFGSVEDQRLIGFAPTKACFKNARLPSREGMREALPLMCTGHPAPHGRIP